MRIDGCKIPKSSFLSVDKDMEIISQKIIANERLKRLLYYTTEDALTLPNLSPEQSIEIFRNNIKRVPKLHIDNSVLNYIFIQFDHFATNETNPEFRDNIIEFDIVCHVDQWELKDFQLRPFRIAAELDSMFDKQDLTEIGKLEFIGASIIIPNSEFAGICLLYRSVHGGEDKIGMPNPEDEELFVKDFNDFLNNLE
jgi:hypothetical protein